MVSTVRTARPTSRVLSAAAALIAAMHSVEAQQTRVGDSGVVSIDRLFALATAEDDKLSSAQWFAGGASYTVLEASQEGGPQRTGGAQVVRYDAATGAREVLVPAGRLIPPGTSVPLDIDSYAFSPDGRRLLLFTNTQRVWRERNRGDYWLFDRATNMLRKLGGPDAGPSTLLFAKFSPDGRKVGYVRDHNLYVEDVAGPAVGHIVQLTSDGTSTKFNGSFDWVYEEELNLRDGWRWSPDGTKIAYWQLDASGVRDYDLIDDTDSLYSFTVPVQYPKAGQTNSASRVGVVSATGGATQWLDVTGDPRDGYIARMQWASSSGEIVIQRLNRLQNTNDVMLGDVRTGTVRSIFTDRDSAWVDVDDDPHWIDGGKSFIWVSETDGWRHAYLMSRDGKTRRLLTPGGFDISEPGYPFGVPFVKAVDTTRRYVYYLASPNNATQLYLYRSRLDGSAARPERVTPATYTRGVHHYDISPNGRWALHTFSRIDEPPTTELVRLPGHEVVRTLVDNAELREAVDHLTRGSVDFTRLDGSNGVSFDAWLMRPPVFDSTKKYPTLFYVYGGPGQATVVDEWDGLNYLQHLRYAQLGYMIASVDNRGTPVPKGRAWRKAIYRKIGVVDSEDQAAAARAYLQRSYADATRVGIWGWSNGGTMTLNALFRSPDLYQVGMAVAPLSDQRYYDTIYSERYMGLPQDNPDVYRIGSPVTFAQNLKGRLLLVHGSGDDNVHFQNTEAVINALVAANRPFTMMDYPNRTHCICEGHNTYRHLQELLSRYLTENLPAGPR